MMKKSLSRNVAKVMLCVCVLMTLSALPAFAKPKQEAVRYTLEMSWNEKLHRLTVELHDMNGKCVESLKPVRGENLKDRCYVVRGIRPKTRIDVPDGWMIDSDIRFSEGIDGAGETFRAPDGSKGRRFYGGDSIMTKKSLSDITIRAPQF